MCVLCVQRIASDQSEIEDPNTREEWREVLKYSIQDYKLKLSTCETEIKQIETENKGESII